MVAATEQTSAPSGKPTPFIALEEHYYPQAAWNSFHSGAKSVIAAQPGVLDKLLSVGAQRIAEMDKGSTAVQVISHGCMANPSPQTCIAGNDELMAAITASRQNTTRFAAFSVLPMGYPVEAAAELERTVKQHGFVGALVDNTVDGKFYEGPEYDVLWAKFTELDVPIYIHPAWPSPEVQKLLVDGHYSEMARNLLSESMWNWHSQVGLHILRLHNGRVFNRFSTLKVVIGHFGEMVPSMLDRIIGQEHLVTKNAPQRGLKEVWATNIWITTSGVDSVNPLATILRNTAVDHILYSVDWPYASYERGKSFMEDLRKSGMVTAKEWEMIGWVNAAKLLKIQLPK